MPFTKNFTTFVTIAACSGLLVSVLPAQRVLAQAQNNGLNLQTGGNGQGNNGCGNGNGGPSGTKDCTHGHKDGLSDSDFDQAVSGALRTAGTGTPLAGTAFVQVPAPT
ncbi:MAG TPA: hypothetical protein V6D19_11435, partial [Stenomitos sp.]